MKKITLIFTVLFSIFQLNMNAQAWQWAVSSESEEAFYSCTDPSGNVYQIGKVLGDATFQGGVTLSQGGAFYYNWFLAKYNTAGQLQWVKEAFAQKGDREVLALTSDADGNIYYAGYFDDTLRVENSSAISHGARDAFLVKMNTNGNLQWIKTGGGLNDDSFNDIVCSNSNIYVVGSFVPNATFETTSLTGVEAGFSTDALLISYSSSGNLNFAKSFGGGRSETGDGIYVYNNKIYFTGYFRSDNAVFQTETINWTGTGGQYDTYLASTNMDGDIQFAKGYSNQINDLFFRNTNSVFVNNSGIYLTGQFSTQVNFGNGPITAPNSSQNGYIAKFNFSGENIWANSFKGEKFTSAQKVIGNNDHVYVAGNFSDSLHILGQSYVGMCENAGLGKNNGFISSWNNDGTLAWNKLIRPYQNPDYLPQIGEFRLNGFSMDNNFLYMSGTFTMTLSLSPYSVSTDGNLSNDDAVLAKIDITANGVDTYDSQAINCYPNPSNSMITFNMNEINDYSINVRAINGQLIHSTQFNQTSTFEINVSNFNKGIYFVEISSIKGIITKKIIVH